MIACDGFSLLGTFLIGLACGMILLAFLWAWTDEVRERKWRKLR